ncbi:GNAT family N-acetyltransferase [Burkholderia multivorans]|uniref:N-acetyltransferase n=1 Tax=Burkholderia multivorans TaxID=87883 RepID=A0AB37AQS4_9BURK|nr:GNAT family N-acetyltransferase [Burkholderia multivorans]KVV25183.1 GCN5 family acetyltransferase [Burkholderia multivorans]KWA38304.1 GCN5 family acetyltransferase [Burkholderia multivorans]MBJ9615535.1 GNAT family N-acetyltransferase [Burkholderia multivorans]MBR8124305.1 GNAT family N-acetyltransferase [Burkholderia multivorans]MBU9201197.1 GNAT family N-acetyltransferase [Burkholderia multivorans]
MPAAADATLRFSTDKRELDVDAIFDFLHRDAYWSKGIPRDVVERAIDGSLCFGAYVGDRFVGFARLVTDHATFAYLCDVFVLPAERGRGYGRALIDHVFAQPMLAQLRRIMLVTSDAHALYRPVGFEAVAHPERMMEIRRPDIYTKR